MSDIDFGPHRKCHVCHTYHSEKRMIDYKGKWFCGIVHKLKHERGELEKSRPVKGSVDDKDLDV